MSRWQSANVLQTTTGLSRLWRFNATGDAFAFDQDQSYLPSESYNSSWVGKNWRSLFRRKCNLAWLPPEKAFLRVLHLPAAEAAELIPMVEFQLEKISPLPVAQIVWSVELLARPADKPDAMQTVIVIIAPRSFVEEHLAVVESKGFMADAVELPSLDLLLNTKVEGNGVWLYVGSDNEPALVAWWFNGMLQNLALIPLVDGEEREKRLLSQLQQMAWAGELDGWLTESPTVHLVAEPAEIAIWEPVIRKWVGDAFKIDSPLALNDLASLSAQRATRESARSNLLPPESAKRYRQQFIDGLWMRGIMTAFGIYAFGVIVYLTILFVMKSKNTELQTYVNQISLSYTNALRDKAQIQIIKDRQELKYAALDCWKAVAQTLPESIRLDEMDFQRGKITLSGSVPPDKQYDITTFHQSLSQFSIGEGEPLFTEVGAPNINSRGNETIWKFTCTLKGGDDLK